MIEIDSDDLLFLENKIDPKKMSNLFPEPIKDLPQADIPIKGLQSYLSQGTDHQIIFMQFTEDVEIAEHFHESQWAVVLEGKIEMVINDVKKTFSKGDRYFIPSGIKHSAKIHAGYADITFFDQADRYKSK